MESSLSPEAYLVIYSFVFSYLFILQQSFINQILEIQIWVKTNYLPLRLSSWNLFAGSKMSLKATQQLTTLECKYVGTFPREALATRHGVCCWKRLNRKGEEFGGLEFYWFPMAAVTNYHKFRGLKQHGFSLSQSWRPESEISFTGLKSRCQQGWLSLRPQRGESFPWHFPVLVAACIPWLVAPSSILGVHRPSPFLLSLHLLSVTQIPPLSVSGLLWLHPAHGDHLKVLNFVIPAKSVCRIKSRYWFLGIQMWTYGGGQGWASFSLPQEQINYYSNSAHLTVESGLTLTFYITEVTMDPGRVSWPVPAG